MTKGSGTAFQATKIGMDTVMGVATTSGIKVTSVISAPRNPIPTPFCLQSMAHPRPPHPAQGNFDGRDAQHPVQRPAYPALPPSLVGAGSLHRAQILLSRATDVHVMWNTSDPKSAVKVSLSPMVIDEV